MAVSHLEADFPIAINAMNSKTRNREADSQEIRQVKGIYTIILRLENHTKCKIGALGSYRFPRGIYLYTGSACGRGSASIEGRMRRHEGRRRRNFWHIDYLLGAGGWEILAFVYSNTERSFECKANGHIREVTQASFPVMGFGSSDCRCPSHLLYLEQYDVTWALYKVKRAYREIGLEPGLRRLG